MPAGSAAKIAGVVLIANGQTLPWRRDDVDLYQFHLTIPPGVKSLHAHLDCIVSDRVSEKLAMLEWESLLLYPARHSGSRDPGAAVGHCSCGLGNWYGVDAYSSGFAGPCRWIDDTLCRDGCGAA